MKSHYLVLACVLGWSGCVQTVPSQPAKLADKLPASVGSATWHLPPFPDSPPPIPSTAYFYRLPPPQYPEEERRRGVIGEVVLVLRVDERQRIDSWKIVRATTEGYAREVARSFSQTGRADGVLPGTYSLRIIFHGNTPTPQKAIEGTFLVGSGQFGAD